MPDNAYRQDIVTRTCCYNTWEQLLPAGCSKAANCR